MTSPSADHSDATRLLAILERFAHESRLPEPTGGIDLDTRLETDLGLDSLSRSELIARIETELTVSLPDQAMLAGTARDLLALVQDRSRVTPGATETMTRVAPSPVPEAADADHPDAAQTLLEALDWHLQRHPERLHIRFEAPDAPPVSISYRALAEGAARVAGHLRQAGLRPGATVALMLPTGPGYFDAFFGVLMAGGIPVPIYPPARPQLIEEHLRRHGRILDNAGVVFLITVPEARTIARVLRVQVPSLRAILTLEELATTPSAPADITQAGPRAAARDIAFLQYTSGSTGDPKGVVLTHADLLANIRAMGTVVEIAPDDVFVSWLPLYHDMGLIGAWLGSLYYAVPLIAMSPLSFLARPVRWLEAIHRHGGTLSAAPNFAYELCLTRITDAQLSELDLSRWRWALNGAEPVSPTTLARFAARFAPCGLRPTALAPVYGLAEAAVGLAFPPLGRGPRVDCIDRDRFAQSSHALPVACTDPEALQIVACGRALPGYQLRVVDAGGHERPDRHEGLLEFRGPSATQGYYRNPEATRALIRDGWHATGDRAYLADGEVYLSGRVKDLIIRGGRNLYPYEVEQALGEIAGVRKGCVVAFAAEDPELGSERLVILAETKVRDPEHRADLTRRLRERATEVLGIPPDILLLVPPRAVLKTSSGKLRRAATRERYLAGRLEEPARRPAWQLLRVGLSGLHSRVRRFPHQLYAGYAWSVFLVLAPWFWIAIRLLPNRSRRWALARFGIRLLRRLTGLRLTVSGRAHLPADSSPVILVANHESYLDGLILSEAVARPLGFVVKQELASRLIVGAFLRRMGAHFVDRFDPHSGRLESTRLAQQVGDGTTLAMFPEGTFRAQPGLLPFRMGAFAAAAQIGVPVIPIVIRGTRALMPGDSFAPRPGTAEVIILPPLEPTGSDWAAAVALRDRARACIAEVLEAAHTSAMPTS
ncbi:acyl-phosphate glycerol 3-phosphate acyltransferase [Thiocapsa imhoffii]|uniref:Acyl-phosphate glycerol 3-phosphate acyltransferase n=1 Tax=Thiocapsa imhoffii TaxID=382777 RepID=A0A9X1B6Y5_9GAMM|nr:AMP-binding protein [Thiocapsa imhoffii]MBK1643127.1 acyl-phosphate glycerol 3-phosphate acyltransferase [Thiocapsa imhoffii]